MLARPGTDTLSLFWSTVRDEEKTFLQQRRQIDASDDADVEAIADADLASQEGLDDFSIDISQFAEGRQRSRARSYETL